MCSMDEAKDNTSVVLLHGHEKVRGVAGMRDARLYVHALLNADQYYGMRTKNARRRGTPRALSSNQSLAEGSSAELVKRVERGATRSGKTSWN